MKSATTLIGSLALSTVLFTLPTHAYQEGTYRCKNPAGLPDNLYKIQNGATGIPGELAPFLTATRYYFEKPSDPHSPIAEASLKGFATVSKTKTTEILILAAIQLVVTDDKVAGCVREP